MANRITDEIGKINDYETTWKIKTNKNKFQIIPIAVKKSNDIIIDGSKLDYSTHGKILGLTINRSGISKHLGNITRKIRTAVAELYRFRSLPTHIKLHLVKVFIIPLLYYSPIPLLIISKTNMVKLQVIQNKSLRFAFNERYPFARNRKTLHELANLEPVN